MQSRQLFKDLVTCSTDFAWETKADGRLGFVSPRGALGFTARELEGRPARELMAADSPATPAPSLLPFEAQQPLEDRKSVVEGKSVTVRVGMGGRSAIKKTTTINKSKKS